MAELGHGRTRSMAEQGTWQNKEYGRTRSMAEIGAWQN